MKPSIFLSYLDSLITNMTVVSVNLSKGYCLAYPSLWIVKAVNLAATEAAKNAASKAFSTPALPSSNFN